MNPQSDHPFWIVLEVQEIDEDHRGCISTIYSSYDAALAAFFQTCSAAASSSLQYHAAVILPSDQPANKQLQRWEIFDRRQRGGG